MASTKDTVFALVPGSFATPAMYDKVIPILEKAGYATKPIALLSANDGSRLPAPQMQDDAAEIRSQILPILDSGKNVVLCLQSYGGFPGTEAVKGLSKKDRGEGEGAVIGIVYAAAFVPDIDQSIRGLMGVHMPEFYLKGIPGGYFEKPPVEMALGVFNDMSDQDEVMKYGSYMTGHSSDTYSGVSTYAAWKDVPATTIIPQSDLIIPTTEQEKMYENAVKSGAKISRVAVEGGGHGITVSQPQLVADELIKLAQA